MPDHAAAARHEPGPRDKKAGDDAHEQDREASAADQDGEGAARPPGPSPTTDELSRIDDPDRDWRTREAREAGRRAYNNITGANVFTGPITIERDLRIGVERRWAGPAIGRVATEDLDQLRTSFAPPPAYGVARQTLTERHLLVLRGRRGWGKSTMALHLVAELVAGKGEVRRLEPDLDLKRIEADDFERGWGYIVDTLASERADRLDSFQLSRLSEVLRSRGAYLTVTVGDRTRLPSDLPDEFKQECVDPSDLDEMVSWRLDMLQGHLRLRLGKPSDRMDALVMSESVRRRLATRPPPKDVVYLATLLVPLAEDRPPPGETLDAALEKALTTFDDRGRQVAERWFKEDQDATDQALKLALAVFNGGTYQSVLDAATELEPLLDRSKGKRRTARRSLFDSARTDRLAQAGAQVDVHLEPTELGWARVELVELHNPALPSALLDFVWHEHDRARGPLLEWLTRLGSWPPIEIRARAAATVGMLSTYGFRHLYNSVLGPWAASTDAYERESAAWALGVPAADPELAPLVLRVVRRWAKGSKSNPELRWTAAAAYGAETGLLFPEAAIQGLRRIAAAEDPELWWVIAESILNLFSAGHHDLVLAALDAWTDVPPPSTRAERGAVCFLWIAAKARVEPPPEGEPWPTLLALSRDDRERDRIVALWRRAFGLGPPIGDLALVVLRRWVRLADDDSRLHELLHPIVVTLAQRPRDRERLVFSLRRWANRPKRPSRTAAKLLTALDLDQEGG